MDRSHSLAARGVQCNHLQASCWRHYSQSGGMNMYDTGFRQTVMMVLHDKPCTFLESNTLAGRSIAPSSLRHSSSSRRWCCLFSGCSSHTDSSLSPAAACCSTVPASAARGFCCFCRCLLGCLLCCCLCCCSLCAGICCPSPCCWSCRSSNFVISDSQCTTISSSSAVSPVCSQPSVIALAAVSPCTTERKW